MGEGAMGRRTFLHVYNYENCIILSKISTYSPSVQNKHFGLSLSIQV